MSWRLANDAVELEVETVGGHLARVRFASNGKSLEPMHRAPWLDEPGASDLPMLQRLQGDFFCAPFGANDLLPEEGRDHGLTANGRWREIRASSSEVELELEGRVSGARVTREVRLVEGHPVVYQIHRLVGGKGKLPLGHHAMLRAPEDETLRLSFSRWAWAGTPPEPVEKDADRGRSFLVYPQLLTDLSHADTVLGTPVDLTRFPALRSSEEIVMLVTDPNEQIGWSAAVAPRSGWIWFGVRPNTVLRNTLLWMSNGGRDYPPFLGRHQRVLGVEEVTSYFHLGHRASVESNELSRIGLPTCVDLGTSAPAGAGGRDEGDRDPAAVERGPRGERGTAVERGRRDDQGPGGEQGTGDDSDTSGGIVTRYAFGAVAAPPGFDRVASLRVTATALLLQGEGGGTVTVPFDGSFLLDGFPQP